ncbi:hypothetical protein C8F04DRAFT_1260634 [Mycena alexandri]|uniref:Uncharacterized protein n=1 Tax=Mycena alexandri TaxID=1745969 RepID=A0AAD6S9P4_9AGAR|nr:hypothetical protein C8F04DRAFT_1271237 [Mycena alexandri]KAJ7033639.1 hypothetical protein C8F04DRAFT_1260634 [Mycena alexandri]
MVCYLQHHDLKFLSKHNEFNYRIYIIAHFFLRRYSDNHNNKRLSLSSAPAAPSQSSSAVNSGPHRLSVGIIFAILIPVLFFLFLLGLARWCRRRRKISPDLEAHPRPPRWFNRPSYQGRSSGSNGHRSTDLESVHAVPASISPPSFIAARPLTLQTIFSNSASSDNATTTPISPAVSDSETEPTWPAFRSLDPVAELQFPARMHALIAANALLAELAGESPPTP